MDIIKWIVGQNWVFYSHQKLYDMVNTEADGMRAIHETDDEIAEFTALMAESVEDVEQALAEAGVAWQGLAAESMTAGVSPLAQWAQDAATAGQSSREGTQRVGESFVYAATAMPEPVPTPSRTMTFPPSVADLIEVQNDQDAAERESQEAKQRAVELMETYSGNSESAMSSLGTFVPPQQVVMTVPARVGGVSDSAGGVISGPAGGGGDGPGPGGSSGRNDGPVDGGRLPAPAQPGPGAGSPGTDPARVTPPASNPTLPAGAPPTAAPVAAPPTVVGPVSGVPGGPNAGRPHVGGGGQGGGRGPGGVAGRGPGGGSAGGAPGRGGAPVAGPLAGEGVASARGGAAPAARGGGLDPGMAPVGAGAGRRDEDKDRTSPEYLRDYRDDFWDDTPPVAPPVIGNDDD